MTRLVWPPSAGSVAASTEEQPPTTHARVSPSKVLQRFVVICPPRYSVVFSNC